MAARRHRWTNSDERWLRDNWSSAPLITVLAHFPGMTLVSITHRALLLGLKRPRVPKREARQLRLAHLHFQNRERTLGY